MQTVRNHHSSLAICLAALFVAACSSIEYRVRETFGQHKREILVDRVQSAKESQEVAKEQFVSALEQFKALTGFEGGEVEKKYEEVRMQYEQCSVRATDVSNRINAVEDVANALFREWEGELREYSSESLRLDSQRKLDQTKRSFTSLMAVMRTAEARMAPVLATLKDQVLYLKHNLNARAIASLGGLSAELERDIDVLVADMEKAIDDAARFIEEMKE